MDSALCIDLGQRSQCFDEPSMSVRRNVTSGTNPVSAYPVGAVAERQLLARTARDLGVPTVRVAPVPPALPAEHGCSCASSDLERLIDPGIGIALVVVMVGYLSQPVE